MSIFYLNFILIVFELLSLFVFKKNQFYNLNIPKLIHEKK